MSCINKLHAWLNGLRSLIATPMASFIVVIGLTAVVGVVALLSQDQSVTAVNRLIEIDGRIGDLSLKSSMALVSARRAERDFFLDRNRSGSQEALSRYVRQVKTHVADIRRNMVAIRELTGDFEMVRLARAIDQGVTLYQDEFLKAVDLHERRSPINSATAAFVNVANTVEPLLENLHARATTVSMAIRSTVQETARAANWTIIIAGTGATLLGFLVAFITSRNITRAEWMLRLRNRAIESSVNAVFITKYATPNNQIEYVNPAFERITGYSQEEALGRDGTFLLGGDTDQPGVADINEAIREKREGHAVLRGYRKDGSCFWGDMYLAPVRDDNSNVTHFVSVLNDITEARKYQEQLEHQANYDLLTELPNRNLLQDRMQQAVAQAQRHKNIVAVALLGIDNFKYVNESLGHDAGDEVLKQVAMRIKDCVRTTDTVARLASDEFVLVLSGIANEDNIPKVLQRVVEALTSRPQVTETLNKVLSTVSRPMMLEGREVDITCSIGVSLYPHDGNEADSLLRSADAAMHRAKELGRNNFQFYTTELNARLGDRLALQTMLRHALVRDEFLLYYQPKVDLESGRVSGAEALLRWNSPDRGMIPPVEFISALEDSGLILDVGKWIIEKAVAQHAEWRKSNPQAPRIAVNISQIQLAQKNFVMMIEEIVNKNGREACGLDIEITESLIMKDIEVNTVKLKAIQELGVGIAIDDFGTGYSSFSYLATLPIDALKIDRSFIINIANNSDHRTIVSTIISLAHLMKHKVIAEGIDTQEQADLLHRLGCDVIQGYYFSRPVPANEFEAWQRGFSIKPGRARDAG
ncbi:MAG: EAL domain-containing protein [Sulfuricaulis sp.]|nr:EAL domain-containing protein [Sulfuricaulis sp.]